MRFISNLHLEKRAEELVRAWRDAEQMPSPDFPIDVQRMATDFLGIQVTFASLEKGIIAEFRVSDEAFVLDRGQNKNRARARFSIAHEIGHLELHSTFGTRVFCRASDVNRQEIQANRFAGALLMPAADVVERLADAVTGLGKFARRTADVDIVTACRWLKSFPLHQALRPTLLRSIAGTYGVSLESLTVRLSQLGLIDDEARASN